MQSNALNLPALLTSLLPSVQEAGHCIMAVRTAGVEARHKSDKSPVTDADEQAEAILVQAIKQLTPDIPIVGEEGFSAGVAPSSLGALFWLLDPLDGTKEFVRGGDDFTVNVALVCDGTPILGLIQTPVDGAIWMGALGHGAWKLDRYGETHTRRSIAVRQRPQAPWTVLVSHSHLDPATRHILAQLPNAEVLSRGSSLKFCTLAEGKGDLYPRWGPTSEWDIAAGHAILAAAGGGIITPEGAPVPYGKPGFLNGPFIAYGAPQALADALTAARDLDPPAR